MAISKIACVVILCIVVLAPFGESAITCGSITSNLAQCLPYLTAKEKTPSGACCTGVKKLVSLASTSADRKIACGCLKSTASSIKNLNLANAAAVPGKCGASIPYAISPSTDCSKVN